MFQTINFCAFRGAFRSHDRNENFSYWAKHLLFDYLEELEESGEPIELDVIALCRDYQESTYAEVIRDYDIQDIDESDEEWMKTLVMKYLEEHTRVIGDTGGSVLFASF